MAVVDELVWVTLVAGTDTPAETAGYVGRVVGIEPDKLAKLQAEPGKILGVVHGHYRASNNGHEWVIGPASDPLVRVVNRLPGAGGWVDTSARDVWQAAVTQLRTLGLPPGQVQSLLQSLYRAALADRNARP